MDIDLSEWCGCPDDGTTTGGAEQADKTLLLECRDMCLAGSRSASVMVKPHPVRGVTLVTPRPETGRSLNRSLVLRTPNRSSVDYLSESGTP